MRTPTKLTLTIWSSGTKWIKGADGKWRGGGEKNKTRDSARNEIMTDIFISTQWQLCKKLQLNSLVPVAPSLLKHNTFFFSVISIRLCKISPLIGCVVLIRPRMPVGPELWERDRGEADVGACVRLCVCQRARHQSGGGVGWGDSRRRLWGTSDRGTHL